MDSTRQSLSYATVGTRTRANWPAIASTGCALVPPIVYVLYIARFGTKTEPSHWAWLIDSGWAVSCGAATLLGMWGLYASIRRRGRQRAWAVLGLLLGLSNGASFPLLREYHSHLSRLDSDYFMVRCHTNLCELHVALDTYAADHGGKFPDSLEQLAMDGYVKNHDILTCPFPPRVPAPNQTTELLEPSPARPPDNRYLYGAKGMSVSADPAIVLVYEPLSNHPPAFPNLHFLFADGHVEAIAPREARKLIEQLQAGVNPPKR